MDALEQPFVLCVHVGTWVEKREHVWSIASVYTGLCPCFLFIFLLVSGQLCFMSVPTLRLCIFHAHKTSWMCTAHKLALSVHSTVIQHFDMVCFYHTIAVKLTSWLSLTRQFSTIFCGVGLGACVSCILEECQFLGVFVFEAGKPVAGICVSGLLTLLPWGWWMSLLVNNLMQGENLGLKISVLNCFLRAVQCCLARSGSCL